MTHKRKFHKNEHGVKITRWYGVDVPDFCFECEGLCAGETYYYSRQVATPSGCTRGRIVFPTRKGSCTHFKSRKQSNET